jgi:hypothetical protein
VFRCVLESEGCVLVRRSSGTPVATWARPTWVVSRRRVLEAVFILLEFPCPSRKIFIGSHSLPPVWFAVSVLQALRSCSPPASCSGSFLRPQYTSPAHLLPNTLPPSRVSPSRRGHHRRPPPKPIAGCPSAPTPATYSS